MLPDTAASKVTAAHLSRRALLYIRQSSLKQVIPNTESAIRQYDLRGKAIALGWAADQITVIDIDQGQSGASAADREGFQQLVAEVSLGRAGIVLGLDDIDWRRGEITVLGKGSRRDRLPLPTWARRSSPTCATAVRPARWTARCSLPPRRPGKRWPIPGSPRSSPAPPPGPGSPGRSTPTACATRPRPRCCAAAGR
jgi:hypothetical protein